MGKEDVCISHPHPGEARGALCQLTQTQGILLGSASACGRESRGGSVDLEVRVGSMQMSTSGTQLADPEAPACLSTGCL